ncbi:MAG: HAD family hydrolase [Pelagimonas sp.]|uniref:HAD family hydrolase n=1 Tax=Pelagimonas sp. TaxID=2073170 RepID=UPI003D6B32AD
MKLRADAVLFDKDGTLFDFGATWDVWGGEAIAELSGGDPGLQEAMAISAGYDLTDKKFRPDSPIIAGTNREAAECLARALPGQSVEEVELYLMRAAAQAPLSEAVPLVPFLAQLAALEMALGVMTNDTEFAARSHLRTAGVEGMFDFVAGFDSGYGAKPDPDPLLAFSVATNIAPDRVIMVGDSRHDLIAGRAAGMQTVGVLTGPATEADLAPLADIVMPDIGGLLGWVTLD